MNQPATPDLATLASSIGMETDLTDPHSETLNNKKFQEDLRVFFPEDEPGQEPKLLYTAYALSLVNGVDADKIALGFTIVPYHCVEEIRTALENFDQLSRQEQIKWLLVCAQWTTRWRLALDSYSSVFNTLNPGNQALQPVLEELTPLAETILKKCGCKF